MDLFTPDPDDLSVQILNNIFGVGWDNFYQGGNVQGNSAVLAQLFQTFNTVVLTGLTLYFVYIFTMHVVGTSHEGTPLGRRYHTVYAPARAALATALLAPVPFLKGFAVIQGLVMIAISFGIGAADTLWSSAVTYLDNHPASLATSQVEGTRPLAGKIFQSLVIRDYLKNQQDLPTGPIRFVELEKPERHHKANTTVLGSNTFLNQPGRYKLTFGMAKSVGLSPGDLGQVIVTCPAPQAGGSNTCTEQMQALDALLPPLMAAADKLTSAPAGATGGAPGGTNGVSAAVAAYNKVAGAYADRVVSAEQQVLTTKLQDFTKLAKSQGWVTAGEWYWHIANLQNAVHDQVTHLPEYSAPNVKQVKALVGDDYQGYLDAAARYSYDAGSGVGANYKAVADSQGLLGKLGQFLTKPFRGILAFYVHHTSGPGALVGVTRVGHIIIDTTAAAAVTYGLYVSGEKATGGTLSKIPIIGGIASSLLGFLSGVGFIKAVAPIIWLFLLSLFGLGMVQAYYLPAIPFLIFTLGIVSWVIISVELVIAAPLWAASHGLVEGEGWAGVYARQGYMLFLSAWLRAPLMIFGLLLSFFILEAVDTVVGNFFLVFFDSLNRGSYFLFALLAGLFLYTGLLTAIYHKVFGLITLLAENVPAWLGQLGHRLGEHTGAQESHRAIAGGADLSGRRGRQLTPRPTGGDRLTFDDNGGGRGGTEGSARTSSRQIEQDLSSGERGRALGGAAGAGAVAAGAAASEVEAATGGVSTPDAQGSEGDLRSLDEHYGGGQDPTEDDPLNHDDA